MNKEQLTEKLLMEYAGDIKNEIVMKTLHDIEFTLREQIAKEIEDLIDPPPIDEIDYIIVDVIKKCAVVARGTK